MFKFFKKEKQEDFEVTKNFNDYLLYDEKRNLIKIKGNKRPISVNDIQTYSLNYGNKTYNKINLGEAIVKGSLFGTLGILHTGTHTEDYISNINIMIKANNKFYYIIMTIGKIKSSSLFAQRSLKSAEEIITFLNEITE